MGGLGDNVAHGVADEPDGHGGAAGQCIDDLLSGLARFVEAGLGAVIRAHGAGDIEEDERGFITTHDADAAIAKGGAGERKGDERNHETAQDEENDVLKRHAALLAIDGDAQKAHRRPDHALDALLRQQVDEDGRSDAGDPAQEPGV